MGAFARSVCGRANSATRGATGWAGAYRRLHAGGAVAPPRRGGDFGPVAVAGLLMVTAAGAVAGFALPSSARYAERPRASSAAAARVGPDLQVSPPVFDVGPPVAAATPPPPAAGGARRLARRSAESEGALLAELSAAPRLGFDQDGAKALYAQLRDADPRVKAVGAMVGPRAITAGALLAGTPEQADMPWLLEPRCTTSPSAVTDLRLHSMLLRMELAMASNRYPSRRNTPARQSATADRLRSELTGLSGRDRWREPGAVPVLVQLLQGESQPVREVLVDVLAAIPGPEATQALARRAVFDLSPACRERAVAALGERPAAESRGTLVAALTYPWPPAADHAAEALAALGDRGALPGVARALDAPDPAEPFRDESGTWHKRELVGINHLSNCVVCHATSASSWSDPTRAAVPTPGQPLRPTYYGEVGADEGSIRFDVTYLRQDFSAVLPVASPDRWPAEQRFDFLARTRRLTGDEVAALAGAPPAKPGRHREAALFALRALTGRDVVAAVRP